MNDFCKCLKCVHNKVIHWLHENVLLLLASNTMFLFQLFDKLSYPAVRQGVFHVISHMLLSFQDSPEAFHKVTYTTNVARLQM